MEYIIMYYFAVLYEDMVMVKPTLDLRYDPWNISVTFPCRKSLLL